ncbi:MAG TPA: dTDP-4-dehydrorhamnose 3,5-epimerase [Acidimicrobiales bacterium]|nr:dTDP-4-dehydrorhamnose 3,5-epimerase [Acidimicrobiales bacterium]
MSTAPDRPFIVSTSIDGLVSIELHRADDERGSFTEAWQTEKMQALGLPAIAPVQMSVSRSRRGVIRGVHAEPWDKYIHVVAGSAFAAIVDLRTESPTFGRHECFDLDGTRAIYVPAGLGNSFQSLDDDLVYTYLVTGLYDAGLAASGGYPAVAFDDPDLAIAWPIGPEGQILSAKDRANPSLREAFPSSFG